MEQSQPRRAPGHRDNVPAPVATVPGHQALPASLHFTSTDLLLPPPSPVPGSTAALSLLATALGSAHLPWAGQARTGMGSRRSLSTAPEEQTLKTLGKEKAATGNGIPAPWAGMTSHSHAPGTGQVLLMLSALWPHQHTPPMVGPCSASRVWGEHSAPAQAGREGREENPPWDITECCTGWTGPGSCW